MKKILSTTAIAGSLCLLGTSATAQFVGPYVGVSGSAAGIATDVSKSSTNSANGSGSAGAVFGLGAIDLGYSIGAGKGSSVAIGATYNPFKGEISGKNADNSITAGSTSRTFQVKDAYTVYIQPTFDINKDASFFIKAFYAHADTSLSGTAVTKPKDLEGYGASAGLRVMLTKDAYVQVEAAYTEFDTVSAKIAETTAQLVGGASAQTNKAAVTRTFTASNPELIEGRITLGFKF